MLDSYLFQLIVILKPDLNSWSNFALSWVHKVTTGTNFVSPIAEEITQSLDHVKMRLTSQLINGISRVLQKLLKYFNGISIWILPVLPLLSIWPVIFVLKLKESVALAPLKSTISPLVFTAGVSLQYCHKLPDAFE